MMTCKPSKLGQTDLVLVYDQSSSDLCMQDYKSIRTAFMICAILVNIQTDSLRLVILLAQPAKLKMILCFTMDRMFNSVILSYCNMCRQGS